MEQMEQNDYREYEDFLEMKIQKDKEDKEKNNLNKKCKKIIFFLIFIIISIIILIIKITNVSFFFHCKLKHDKIYHCENYWKNNDVYEGEFKNGKRHGEGIYFYENEFFYIGDWKKDKIDGEKGIFIKNNNEAYIGKWENGEIIEGNYRQSNIYIKKEIILSTEFFDENYKGILNKIIGNKDVVHYEGTFKDWKFNGKGKYINKNGDIYEGEFKDNKYNGYGKMIYKNGDKYEGQWKNGKKHGEGTMTIYHYIRNSKQHCIWENDECIKEIK